MQLLQSRQMQRQACAQGLQARARAKRTAGCFKHASPEVGDRNGGLREGRRSQRAQPREAAPAVSDLLVKGSNRSSPFPKPPNESGGCCVRGCGLTSEEGSQATTHRKHKGVQKQPAHLKQRGVCRAGFHRSTPPPFRKLTWLVLGGDPAARSHRVEQFTAL